MKSDGKDGGPPEQEIGVRLLGPGDKELIAAASHLFDHPPTPDQTTAFLTSDRDYIWVAYTDGEAVGFASATILLHPDKPPHLFLQELGVDEDHRRRGVATKIMETAIAFAGEMDLLPLWLAAEADDDQANTFYRSLPDKTERGSIVYEWEK